MEAIELIKIIEKYSIKKYKIESIIKTAINDLAKHAEVEYNKNYSGYKFIRNGLDYSVSKIKVEDGTSLFYDRPYLRVILYYSCIGLRKLKSYQLSRLTKELEYLNKNGEFESYCNYNKKLWGELFYSIPIMYIENNNYSLSIK